MGQKEINEETRRWHELARYVLDINRLHHNATEKYVDSFGIHRSQHMMLMYLANHDEINSQKSIANDFGISPAAVATSLKKMEREGYIERRADPRDTRYNTISITKKGRDICRKSCAIFSRVDRAMFEGFSEKDLMQFTALMQRITDNLLQLQENDADRKD